MTTHALPSSAGVGLKPEHYRDVMTTPEGAGLWVEVHPENYMTDGGPRRAWLEAIRQTHAVSLHGVGLSLAGGEALDAEHLARWRELIARFEPAQISEHVAWSVGDGTYFADLLPTPATHEALDRLTANIDRMQNALGRKILIENPSLYVALKGDMGEPEFLTEACRRTGCGLLLDVNNVFVSANNIGLSAEDYIDTIPGDLIGEVHLAGHAPDAVMGKALLIDDHGAPVAPEVWTLYERLIARVGAKPTLIERDTNIPAFAELAAELQTANAIMERVAAPPVELAHA